MLPSPVPAATSVRAAALAAAASAVLVLPLAAVLPTAAAAPATAPMSLSAVTAAATAAAASAPTARAGGRQIVYSQWDGNRQWKRGRMQGAQVAKGQLSISDSTQRRRKLGGTTYDAGQWTSPWAEPGFALTRLIASWSARTPGNSWVEVRVRGRNGAGKPSSWDTLARWASGDKHLERTTFGSQEDDLGRVNVDTWETGGATSYQLRVTMGRRAGASLKPRVDTVGAVASRLPSGKVGTSKPGPGRGIVLDVPRYSQMIHRGHFPQWGNGGQAWCSPTSTSMVMGYYDSLPKPRSYRWVGSGHPHPFVDYAARATYDYSYRGTGNWPFNTAYAAPRVGKAFVTRLRSLREAERFIKAGIPLITSISFGAGDLDGTPISATNGHLLVVVGFTQSGDVVVNDPAASSSSGVRRTYDRAQFENAWLPTSGGTTYVIRDKAHPLPGGKHTNW